MNVAQAASSLNLTEQQVFIRARNLFGSISTRPLEDYDKYVGGGALPQYVLKYLTYRIGQKP